MTKSTNEILALNVTIANNLLSLRSTRKALDADLFKKANTALYELLADIFFNHSDIAEDKDERAALINWYKEEVKAGKLPKLKTTSPNLIDVMTRIVFAETDKTTKRVAAYARVLKVLNKVENGFSTKAELLTFVEDKGGIESIDGQLLTKNGVSKKEQTEAAVAALKENFADVKTSFKQTLKVKEVTAAATELKGKTVALVGEVQADGSIVLKHVCAEVAFAGREKNYGGAAVTAALKNMVTVQSDAIENAIKAKQPKKAKSTAKALVEQAKKPAPATVCTDNKAEVAMEVAA